MIHGEDANGSRSCKTPASGFWNLTSKTLAQINIIVRRWPLTVVLCCLVADWQGVNLIQQGSDHLRLPPIMWKWKHPPWWSTRHIVYIIHHCKYVVYYMISSYHAFMQMKASTVSGLWSAWEETLDDPILHKKVSVKKKSENNTSWLTLSSKLIFL